MEATASTKSAAAEDVRAFTIAIPDEQIEDLRSRIEATRLPKKETVESDKTLDVLVDRTYPLQDATSAHRDLESQQTVGKLLLIP